MADPDLRTALDGLQRRTCQTRLSWFNWDATVSALPNHPRRGGSIPRPEPSASHGTAETNAVAWVLARPAARDSASLGAEKAYCLATDPLQPVNVPLR